jgi:hypothetical protein
MTSEHEQTSPDEWQTAEYEATYRYSLALRRLHETNPWPDHPALTDAINTLATELWDRGFKAGEISDAFQSAIAGLPGYAAGDDLRP